MATCSVSTLIDEACASGFKCLDEQTFRGLLLQLLCNVESSVGGVAWGAITGTLSNQTDLQAALDAKQNLLTLPLGVTSGGSGTATQFTAGSVVFAGASGVYSQDNANLFFDDTNNRLMVGTNTAYSDGLGTSRLTVSGLLGPSGIQLPLTTSAATAGVIAQNGAIVFHTYGETAVGNGQNIFIGAPVGRAGNFSTTGIGFNVGIGGNALAGLTSGTRNMAVGTASMQSCTSGVNNVGIGDTSLFGTTTGGNNVGIGQNGGRANTTGSQNTYLGALAGYQDGTNTTPNNLQNAVAIGYASQVGASNCVVLGGLIAGLTVNVGVGIFIPTARMHLPAGTTAASSAPLKFTSGTNMTTAETGAMEYNGTNLLFTRSGTTRENVLMSSAVTTEVIVSDTSVTVNIGGTTYKLLARA